MTEMTTAEQCSYKVFPTELVQQNIEIHIGQWTLLWTLAHPLLTKTNCQQKQQVAYKATDRTDNVDNIFGTSNDFRRVTLQRNILQTTQPVNTEFSVDVNNTFTKRASAFHLTLILRTIMLANSI